MTVWAIADLHLAFSTPAKSMSAFGEPWIDYGHKIKESWEKHVQPDDLVLIAGDISWATNLDKALIDLNWIHQLPGTKVLTRGNHDYWWSSPKKVRSVLPPSIHIIQNDSFNWKGISIAGVRLWDSPEYQFDHIIEFKDAPEGVTVASRTKTKEDIAKDTKIFERDLHRLELSLKTLDPSAHTRIAMIHYPPIGTDLAPTKTSKLLNKYNIDICVFGHLHSVKNIPDLFGESDGTTYHLTSCDYLNFIPKKIMN